jgi:hypothetical protein
MTPYSKLTPDYEDYLLRLVFGKEISIAGCISSAYLDLCRTLHGMGKLAGKEDLRKKAETCLAESLSELKAKAATLMQQSDFDAWHRSTCEKLILVYGQTFAFHAGQAQKWLNMTLKYIYTIGEDRIPGFASVYPLCHAPLDKYVLEALWQYGFEVLSKVWSQIDYDEYLKCQQWIRDKFKPSPPLSIEFYLWMGTLPRTGSD